MNTAGGRKFRAAFRPVYWLTAPLGGGTMGFTSRRPAPSSPGRRRGAGANSPELAPRPPKYGAAGPRPRRSPATLNLPSTMTRAWTPLLVLLGALAAGAGG